VRFIGLDVHKDSCEVAVVEGAACFSGPRVASTPEELEVFAQSLGPKDHVVLEAMAERWPSPGSSSPTWAAW
jgi:transposase